MKAKKKKNGLDLQAKIILIGDSGVGKTNILMRFCDNDFSIAYSTTVGIDFRLKTIDIFGKKVQLQIWDTGGQQRFKSINQSYYRNSSGIILVYSICDHLSFSNVCNNEVNIENWLKQIHENTTSQVIKILIANKSDLNAQRKVSYEQGKKLGEKYGMTFLQVSALNGEGINELFNKLGQQIWTVLDSKNSVNNNNISLIATEELPKNEKKCYCSNN